MVVPIPLLFQVLRAMFLPVRSWPGIVKDSSVCSSFVFSLSSGCSLVLTSINLPSSSSVSSPILIFKSSCSFSVSMASGGSSPFTAAGICSVLIDGDSPSLSASNWASAANRISIAARIMCAL